MACSHRAALTSSGAVSAPAGATEGAAGWALELEVPSGGAAAEKRSAEQLRDSDGSTGEVGVGLMPAVRRLLHRLSCVCGLSARLESLLLRVAPLTRIAVVTLPPPTDNAEEKERGGGGGTHQLVLRFAALAPQPAPPPLAGGGGVRTTAAAAACQVELRCDCGAELLDAGLRGHDAPCAPPLVPRVLVPTVAAAELTRQLAAALSAATTGEGAAELSWDDSCGLVAQWVVQQVVAPSVPPVHFQAGVPAAPALTLATNPLFASF